MSVKKQGIIDKILRENRTVLTEVESKELLGEAGISVIETKMASSREEAISIGKQFGYPLALKILSPNVVHKSDAGAVKLGLKTSKQFWRREKNPMVWL